jgi:hypothetical protein
LKGLDGMLTYKTLRESDLNQEDKNTIVLALALYGYGDPTRKGKGVGSKIGF